MTADIDKRPSHRRTFLAVSAAALGSAALFQTFRHFLSHTDEKPRSQGFGPLQPAIDETSGLTLIALPDGFRYLSFGWAGEPMRDGVPTPRNHDGMAVIDERGGILTLCRNHEIEYGHTPFTPAGQSYDPQAAAGCTLLRFDATQGRWKDARGALSGTLRNCAGGATPWKSWLTCEETVLGKSDRARGHASDHGWIFEVPADGPVHPVPLRDMGRFVHEAVAVDPATGDVYETEDRDTAGFYRFQPKTQGRLADGGTLRMLKVPGADDLRRGSKAGQTYDVAWVDIPDPAGAKAIVRNGKYDDLAVFKQGKQRGGTTFARLEGCWSGDGKIFFVSTNGGRAKCGQVWALDPKQQTLTLVFESPGSDVLNLPDNVAVSPRGGLVLCEDGDVVPQRLLVLSPDGGLFPLAANNIVLQGERGFRGDFRKQEWAGATFSSDGRWLFANIQTPGLTLAITGPWDKAGL